MLSLIFQGQDCFFMNSKPDRFQRIEAIFHEALEVSGDARSALIAAQCGGDPIWPPKCVCCSRPVRERSSGQVAAFGTGAGQCLRIGRQADWPLCAGWFARTRRYGRRLSCASRRRRVRAEGGYQADRSAAGEQHFSRALPPGAADSGWPSAPLHRAASGRRSDWRAAILIW